MTKGSAERESVEVEGQSIDDAIELALQRLGVARDKVDIEILSHRPRGLFGLRRPRASVRATLRRPLTLPPDADRHSEQGAPSRRAADAAPAAAPPSADTPMRLGDQSARSSPSASPPATDATLCRACGVLEDIVRLTGTAASVDIVHHPGGARLVIAGDADSLLIGRRGQTLDALEYLLNRILTHADAASPPLTVDVQGYRLRRQQTLEALAQRAAARARANGRPVALSPMSPRDRRIVHMALRNSAALTTRSAGTGFYRKVLIIPDGAPRGGRSRSSQPS